MGALAVSGAGAWLAGAQLTGPPLHTALALGAAAVVLCLWVSRRGRPGLATRMLLALAAIVAVPAAAAGDARAIPLLVVGTLLLTLLRPVESRLGIAVFIGLPLLATADASSLGLAVAQLGLFGLLRQGHPHAGHHRPEAATGTPRIPVGPEACPRQSGRDHGWCAPVPGGALRARARTAGPPGAGVLRGHGHELRTPLHAVLGLIAMLAESIEAEAAGPSPSTRRTIDQLQGSAAVLAQRLGAVLDPEPGTAAARSQCVDADLRTLVDELRHTLRRSGTPVHCELPTRPVAVAVGPRQLRAALLPLLGSPRPTPARGAVRMRLEIHQDRGASVAVLAVEIPGAASLDASQGARGAGSAPGPRAQDLQTVHQLARRVGGVFRTLHSGPGRSTQWELRLPVRPAAADDTGQPAAARLPPGLRVLVVEDEPVNRKVVCAQLTSVGCTCVVAADGQDALRQIDPQVRVVLMDQEMPIMDGPTATRALRLRGFRGPILALTANAGAADRALCLDAGMDAVLVKPISRADLVRELCRWLGPMPASRDSGLVSVA